MVWLLVVLTGCSSTSTLYRTNAPALEAEVIGGTRDAVLVDDGTRQFFLPRADVVQLDHAGSTHTVAGTGIAVYGGLNVITGLPVCSESSNFSSESARSGFCAGLFIPLAVGAGMIVWGLVTKSRAQAAWEDQSLTEPSRMPPGWPPPAPRAGAAP